MSKNYESWNETAKNLKRLFLAVCILCFCFVAQLIFTYLGNVKELHAQEQQTFATQPITAQQEKKKEKNYWSLTLRFEEGGSDE